ncbi:glycosyltransferase family 4 protein [Candidatus Leptofilum sp.]|uniref:glycosyltransferase family 4 protein n=1 Tax=Candidatus Leptofilum sp. TaxID=3241576 RepID=UPI003B58B84B
MEIASLLNLQSPISPKMRIAMVGPFGLHPNKTMASRAMGLARSFAQQGHAVKIFMPPWQTPEEADKSWQEDGVEMRYVPLVGGILGITRRMVREILAWQPDVVHCFKPKAYSGLVAWWLWQFHRSKLRLIMDTDDWEGWGGWNELAPYTPLQKRFFAWQEQWGMCHCHALTVASRALQTLAWGMGVPPERVVYVPNGSGISNVAARPLRVQLSVIGEQYSVSSRPTVLVYSRLFEFETGRLVEILRGVKTAVPQLRILMVGAGLYEADAANFRQQAEAAGIWEAIEDVGWVELEQLPALLAQAHVGIYLMEDTLLNRTKCPVKLADMLAVGVPVVAEAVGQVGQYVVNGRTGSTFPTGDIEGIANELIHILQNPEHQAQLAAGAKAHIAENFSWEKLADRLWLAYKNQSIDSAD